MEIILIVILIVLIIIAGILWNVAKDINIIERYLSDWSYSEDHSRKVLDKMDLDKDRIPKGLS